MKFPLIKFSIEPAQTPGTWYIRKSTLGIGVMLWPPKSGTTFNNVEEFFIRMHERAKPVWYAEFIGIKELHITRIERMLCGKN